MYSLEHFIPVAIHSLQYAGGSIPTWGMVPIICIYSRLLRSNTARGSCTGLVTVSPTKMMNLCVGSFHALHCYTCPMNCGHSSCCQLCIFKDNPSPLPEFEPTTSVVPSQCATNCAIQAGISRGLHGPQISGWERPRQRFG